MPSGHSPRGSGTGLGVRAGTVGVVWSEDWAALLPLSARDVRCHRPHTALQTPYFVRRQAAWSAGWAVRLPLSAPDVRCHWPHTALQVPQAATHAHTHARTHTHTRTHHAHAHTHTHASVCHTMLSKQDGATVSCAAQAAHLRSAAQMSWCSMCPSRACRAYTVQACLQQFSECDLQMPSGMGAPKRRVW